MAKSNVYTKKGDSGETGLVSGSRISKADPRIDLYGNVDELNSHIGVALTHLKDIKPLEPEREFLLDVQSALFDLGSSLACEAPMREKYQLPTISEEIIETMEWRIDQIDGTLPKLSQFILPGGHIAASYLHICRTVCRRVERCLCAHKEVEELPVNSLEFINRLSDYFFVLSRRCNHIEGRAEIYWKSSKK